MGNLSVWPNPAIPGQLVDVDAWCLDSKLKYDLVTVDAKNYVAGSGSNGTRPLGDGSFRRGILVPATGCKVQLRQGKAIVASVDVRLAAGASQRERQPTMTAAIGATPSPAAPSSAVTVAGTGFDLARTRLLREGLVMGPTICLPAAGAFSRSVTLDTTPGIQTISAEQYVSGSWVEVATVDVTVVAPTSGSGTYPADRPFSAVSATLAAVPARPAYLGTSIDTALGVRATRITNANQDRHAYSRCGPGGWSKDGDRILMNFGTVTSHIIDANTGADISSGGGYLAMACWDPLDNNKLYGVSGNAFKSQNATTKAITTVHTFGAYTTISLGEYEGGISDDGKYVSLIADGTRLITYRIDIDTVVADIAAPAGISDSQISPSGLYVTAGCSAGKRRYPRDLSSSIVLDSNNNHADSALDESGADVLVTNNPSTGKVTSYRLSDGAPTQLFGTFDTAWQNGHVGRARLRPGWIYLSVYDTVNMAGRRGNDLIVAVKLDGSQTCEVFGYANNRTDGSTYAAQVQACPSPDGSRVVGASCWGSSTALICDFIWEAA